MESKIMRIQNLPANKGAPCGGSDRPAPARALQGSSPAPRFGSIFSSMPSAEDRKDPSGSSNSLTRTSAYSTAGLSVAAPSCPWPREQDKIFTASNFEVYGSKKGPVVSAMSWLQGMIGEGDLPADVEQMAQFSDGPGCEIGKASEGLLGLWRYQGLKF